jgi:hypothetical protein
VSIKNELPGKQDSTPGKRHILSSVQS